MQMQSAYSATINPVTEVVTPLTAQRDVPAERRRTRHGDRVLLLGHQRHHRRPAHHQRRRASPQLRDVRGSTVAGDAVFSPAGTEIAYVTVPSSEDTCGATWNATLRILNLATGAAVIADARRVLAGGVGR